VQHNTETLVINGRRRVAKPVAGNVLQQNPILIGVKIPVIGTRTITERRNESSEAAGVLMGRPINRRLEDFSADSVRVAAERSPAHYGLHIAADHSYPTRNREVPIEKHSRTGTSSVSFPQRARIKQQFVAREKYQPDCKIGKTALDDRGEDRERTRCEGIYGGPSRARFYGTLEAVLIAVIQYVKHGKDGGLLGYRILVGAGVIPQKGGKHHPAVEPQKPRDLKPDSAQARIRVIATEMVRRVIERKRFFTEPLPEMDTTEEEVRPKR